MDVVLRTSRGGEVPLETNRDQTDLGVGGNVKVDNHVDVWYVKTTTGDVRSDQNRSRLGLELVQSSKPLWLRGG